VFLNQRPLSQAVHTKPAPPLTIYFKLQELGQGRAHQANLDFTALVHYEHGFLFFIMQEPSLADVSLGRFGKGES